MPPPALQLGSLTARTGPASSSASSASAHGSANGSFSARPSLGPAGSSFNRDAARMHILANLPSGKHAAPASGATSHRLLETLTSLSRRAAVADKENAANCSISGGVNKSIRLGSTVKKGGARRVAVNKDGSLVAATSTSAAVAPAPAPSALSAASWESEKATLIAQLASERSAHETTRREHEGAMAALRDELAATQQALAARSTELEQAREMITEMKQAQAQAQIGSAFGDDDTAEVQLSFVATAVPESSSPSVSFAGRDASEEDTAVVLVGRPVLSADAPSNVSLARSPATPAHAVDASALEPVSESPMQPRALFAPATGANDDEEDDVVFAPTAVAVDAEEASQEDVLVAEAAPSASVAVTTAAATKEDAFAPVTPEDMETSLSGSEDPFAHAESEGASERAAVNESSASLNLSLNGSALTSSTGISPFRAGPLPGAFLSNHSTPSAMDASAGLEGLLSPIGASPACAPATSSTAAASSIPSYPSQLTASALKIQARFRGHMERSYLARGGNGHGRGGEEARLASLPLTSPSTPAQAKKRQRMSSSPLAFGLLRADGTVDEEEEEGLLAQRELSFEEKPAPRAASAAAAAPSGLRAPTPLSLSIPIPLPTPSSSVLAPISSSLPPLPPSECKRLSGELKSLRPVLSSLDACWTLRSKALNRVEAIIRERGTGGMAAAENAQWWAGELAHMQRGLGVQLSDLRSSILREACRLLIAVCEASPLAFEDQLAFYAPLLLKGLYVTIKIISSTSDETLAEIVERCATVSSVLLLIHYASTDSHAVVREKCATYIGAIVAKPDCTAEELEQLLPSLASVARGLMADTDGKVRGAWRALWTTLRATLPASATLDSATSELPQAVLKALEQDRKAAGKAAAGAKRKNMARNT